MPCAGSTCACGRASSWRSPVRPASGKSTLLHLLGGLNGPTAAASGWTASAPTPAPRRAGRCERRKRIGIVFQFFNLVSNLTVADNVELPALLAGRSPRQARASAARSCWPSSG